MKLLLGFLLAGLTFAQSGTPNVVNARFETRAFSGTLEAQLRAVPATWFGYAIQPARGDL
jgi:hypothetical protein